MGYIADATRLEPGSILRVEKPYSSSGKPTYPHFFVVLSVPESISVGTIIPLVGISSRIDRDQANPSMQVPMKWLNRKGGDPETGFEKPCYACVDFTHILDVYRGNVFRLEVAAEDRGKFVRSDKLQAVVATFNAWVRRDRP